MREHNLRIGMGYGFSYSLIDFSGGVCEPPYRLQYVEKSNASPAVQSAI